MARATTVCVCARACGRAWKESIEIALVLALHARFLTGGQLEAPKSHGMRGPRGPSQRSSRDSWFYQLSGFELLPRALGLV